MYVSFTKLSALKSNLQRDKAVLKREKECLEQQISRLAANTQTDAVRSDLKKISAELDGQLQTAQRMISLLERVAECYSQGEDRIIGRIEDGEEPVKTSFIRFQSYPDAEILRRLLS